MWNIQKNLRVKKVTEEELRERLRRGRYSGLELARKDGDDTWKPLYDTDIFNEEAPHNGNPQRSANMRQAKGFFSHLLTFAAVMAFMGMPKWGYFWGIKFSVQYLNFLF